MFWAAKGGHMDIVNLMIEKGVYGTIEQDKKFRIVDKTVATKDPRKVKRGKICFNGWNKPELIVYFGN